MPLLVWQQNTLLLGLVTEWCVLRKKIVLHNLSLCTDLISLHYCCFHLFSFLFYPGSSGLYIPPFGFFGSLLTPFYFDVILVCLSSLCCLSWPAALLFAKCWTADIECHFCLSLVFLGDVDNPICVYGLCLLPSPIFFISHRSFIYVRSSRTGHTTRSVFLREDFWVWKVFGWICLVSWKAYCVSS